MKSSLVIGWLYPDLMSIYGDRGNIITLTRRCEWRGITTFIKRISLESPVKDLAVCDLLFMGGAQDRQQKIVMDDMQKGKHETLTQMIHTGTPGLYICGAYQFLGKYYKEADGTMIEGLGVLDLYTIHPGLHAKRLIGNVVAKLQLEPISHKSLAINHIVGFENHGGRTYLGEEVRPLAKVIKGYGNNGEDRTEGAIYKNTLCSYFHGPILPKNPVIADYLIQIALEEKYKEEITLEDLDDTLEHEAQQAIIRKLGVSL